ncbi:H-NS histone family protein [uncultured Sutterella sp.]|uniref:H-NS histone family protein n=1 Tax=uncultured Sutterella sp. TaxID=286133 RepID=UPI002638E3E4|nr:H-NS histone family protein [uncultured Sutterella sp.]
MTSDEIIAQVNAHREKESKLLEEWQELRARAQEECIRLIDVFEFTASDLHLGKDGKAIKPTVRNAGVPKFINPDGPETWTGRGKRPQWYIKAREAGYSDDDMLIANNTPVEAK